MSSKIKLLMPFLLSSFFVTHIQAADSLLSLYHAALNFDAQYKGKVADTEADREEINKARALFYPKAQLGGSYGRGDTDRVTQTLFGPREDSLRYDTKNLALTVRQPLFNKETLATYRSAKAYVKGKEAVLQSETSSLITRIASAYFELLYAEEKSTVLQNKLSALSQQLGQANKRYEFGEGTVTEISEAQASLDVTRAELLESQNSVEAYKLALSNMTGLQVYTVAKLNTQKMLDIKDDFGRLDDWIKMAIENSPEILSAQYALEVAQQEVEKKHAGHLPTLDLVGVRSYSENDSNNTLGSQFDTTTVALQFNLPLYAGGFVNASVRQSVSRVEAAREELNQKTRDVSTSIQKYFQHLQSELLSMQAYTQAVKSSEIALDGTSKSFSSGFRTNIDVLNAQQRLYENKLKLSKSYYVLVNDIVNIKHIAGVLDEAQLLNINQFFLTN